MKRFSILVSLLFTVLFLCSCQEDRAIQYTLPSYGEMHSIEITDRSGYHSIEISDGSGQEADVMQQFEEWQKRRASQDKYAVYSKAWNRDSELEEKEEELEDYCDSLFSNSCIYNLWETCDHNGCRAVDVQCKLFRDTDGVCIKHDIKISSKFIE
jgi:hypothetical protein